jgi:hypothetical protein
MNETVRSEIMKIRASGETNMFHVPTVLRIAAREGYMELVDYLAEHTPEYAQFILYGEQSDEE